MMQNHPELLERANAFRRRLRSVSTDIRHARAQNRKVELCWLKVQRKALMQGLNRLLLAIPGPTTESQAQRLERQATLVVQATADLRSASEHAVYVP